VYCVFYVFDENVSKNVNITNEKIIRKLYNIGFDDARNNILPKCE